MKTAINGITWRSDAWVVINEGSAMKFTRRDLLVWGAGAAAGLIVTPVPWKVLDDVSMWSQNWPWIPQPARGPIEIKSTSCTLCPSGCGLRVRMAAGWPVGVAGSATHPVSRGALCPLAFGAHQLNWHPQRQRNVQHHSSSSSWNDALSAFAKACNEGPIVVIDGYPGRAASSIFQAFAHKQRGSYRVVRGPEMRALIPYETWTGAPASSLGYDLENTKTILSLGAPLLDGWGTPGRFHRFWAEHASGMQNPDVRLIQVEPSLSRTAGRAWRWIWIREGSENAFAAGLGRALIEQKLVPAHGPLPPMSLADAAVQTGLSADAFQSLARTISEQTPTVAIGRDYSPSIAALNVLLGSVGEKGGIVRRSRDSEIYESPDAPISNARAVLIDASVPWDFVPQSDAEIFRFAAWNGGPTKSDWLLPAPGFLEDLTDIPSAPTSSIETYAVAPQMLKPVTEVKTAVQFLNAIDSSLPSVDKVIDGRCNDLFRKRTGSVIAQNSVPLTTLSSAQKLKEQLVAGAVWEAESPVSGKLQCELKEWPNQNGPAASENWAAAWPAPVLPPLASKLYIESSLRENPDRRTL